MSYPMIELGGIPIAVEAGAPSQATDQLRGSATVRMSDGAGVKMTHFRGKAVGSISGSGLLPPGLDGLDYSAPLELRLTKPRSKNEAGPVVALDAACRPDREPWAFALVEARWVPAPCTRDDMEVTVAPVTGASRYMVEWMPVYMVFADEPASDMSTSHNWSIPWEEV